MTPAGDPLDGVESLGIRQDAAAGRRFRITDAGHREILIAAEQSDAFTRMLLGRYRPCTIWIVTPGQLTYLELQRPFRFMLFELKVRDRQGLDLGRIERDFSIARPSYSVYDAIGREVYRIRRHPEDRQVFCAMHGGRQAALLHRLTHTADDEELRSPEYFRINFAADVSLAHRKLLLGALFLVHEDGFGSPRVTVEVDVGVRS